MPQKHQQRLLKDAPEFVQHVQQALNTTQKGAERRLIIVILDEFYDNAVLLYLALWYADTKGVAVMFEPTVRLEQTVSTPSGPPKK